MTEAERRKVWHDALDSVTIELLEQMSWLDPRDYLADCVHCGRPFWIHARWPTARYCDLRCLQRAHYRRTRRAA